MAEDNQHLHINIYKDNKEKIDSSPNKSESYLIAANEELNNKVRELLNELSTCNAEKDTLLEENERMEKSITYQRGLLHNFNGLKNFEKNRASLYEKSSINRKDHMAAIREYVKKLTAHRTNIGMTFAFMTMFFVMISVIDFTSAVTFAVSLVGSFYGTQNFSGFNRSEIKDINRKFDNKGLNILGEIKDIESEINLITSKSDFISDFIDVA
jgi:hypothetical protein